MSLSAKIPPYAQDLMNFYSPPHQGAWGTVIFYEQIPSDAELEAVALAQYEYFVGGSTRDFMIWRPQWKLIYERTPDCEPNIRVELDAATWVAGLDYEDRIANVLQYDYDSEGNFYEPKVLAAGFNSPEAQEFQVYTIGDGEVMEGLLALSRRRNGETITLAFLKD
ncbi:hypothetical protein K4A83_00405 [Spirulina subsalsa FACHB-351]|uniref:Uncharacterized protein n=1 Tax=Spirulina subsalsa FACHB-351 TaxID=234711 RepID=A0ABT3KZR1_9CYAN|nr:hypothetical protein [Spirulina subsalsa]MCW6034739.1 hypothetical protein [Spirulina subsalsa FACHB-351]